MRRGQRWDPGNGSREGCLPETTTCWPRSADGSSTKRSAALQDGRCSRGSMHGSRGVESALTQRAGAGLGALSLVLGPCYPNRLRPGLANDALAPPVLHHCFTAAQANLGIKAEHELAPLILRFAAGACLWRRSCKSCWRRQGDQRGATPPGHAGENSVNEQRSRADAADAATAAS